MCDPSTNELPWGLGDQFQSWRGKPKRFYRVSINYVSIAMSNEDDRSIRGSRVGWSDRFGCLFCMAFHGL